nr:MAG TPA: hypothetical protein [Caudoviricetes sp.]
MVTPCIRQCRSSVPATTYQIPTRTIRAKAQRTTLILPAAPLAFFERITTKNQTQPTYC